MSAANGLASSGPGRRVRRDCGAKVLRSSPGSCATRTPRPGLPSLREPVDDIFGLFSLPAFMQEERADGPGFRGAPTATRTRDLPLRRRSLYPLSYQGLQGFHLTRDPGGALPRREAVPGDYQPAARARTRQTSNLAPDDLDSRPSSRTVPCSAPEVRQLREDGVDRTEDLHPDTWAPCVTPCPDARPRAPPPGGRSDGRGRGH